MESYRHLMLTPDSVNRHDMATDLGMGLITAGGLNAVTPQAVGIASGISRQAVHQWFGGQRPLREAVAAGFVRRWQRWVGVRVHVHGVAGLLPDTPEVVGWCRVWLALVEQAPRDRTVAGLVELVRAAERASAILAMGAPGASREVA